MNDIPSASELKQEIWDAAIKDIVSTIKQINKDPKYMPKVMTIYEGSTYAHVLTDEFIEYIVHLFESKGYRVVIEHFNLSPLDDGSLIQKTAKKISIYW